MKERICYHENEKRILSLVLAVMLIVAMAVPASAYTVVMGRQWGSFIYNTSDTCYLTDFTCVIESGSSAYTLQTDVEAYRKLTNGTVEYYHKYTGNTGTLIATNAAVVGRNIAYINCYHYIGGTRASIQRVEPG